MKWIVIICLTVMAGCGTVTPGQKYEFDKRWNKNFEQRFEPAMDEWFADKMWMVLGGGAGVSGILAAFGIHLRQRNKQKFEGMIDKAVKKQNGEA